MAKKRKKKPKYPIAAVWWLDACFTTHDCYFPKEIDWLGAQQLSVGHLINETKKWITLGMCRNEDDGHFREILQIPKCNVTKVK